MGTRRARVRRMATFVGISLLAAMIGSGCGAGTDAFPDGAIAVPISSDLGTGPGRLVVGIVGPDGARLGSSDAPVALEVKSLDAPGDAQRADAQFGWIIPDVTGVYRATFDFSVSGRWSVTVIPESGSALQASGFIVRDQTAAPGVGERAPSVSTPTIDDFPLAALTTDPDPDPRFYRTSLDRAFAAGKTTVVVFSTPAFCRTAACGPLLDIVKQVAPDHPEIEFVHVEVYTGFDRPDFVPDAAHLAPAVGPDGWNLPSEPWVFVVGNDGRVTARFEGVMDPGELIAALRA